MSNLDVNEVVNNKWCLASHHMTPAIDRFYDAQPYSGMISIIISNGKMLKITHIETIKLKTDYRLLVLKNVLCVADIKKNLISIQS